MAAVENEHNRSAKVTSPQSNSLNSAPRPSSRTRLHGFSFPTLSWGTHRLLRCSKNGNGPASLPTPEAPDTPSPDKEKPHRTEGGGAGGSLQRQRAAQGPWNLRARRSATAAPTRPAWSEDAAEEAVAADRAPAPATEMKKRAFSIALSKQEIVEDFAAIRGTRPPRRPKKRPRTVQRQLDLLYPGLCLSDVTPGSYKIEEVLVKALHMQHPVEMAPDWRRRPVLAHIMQNERGLHYIFDKIRCQNNTVVHNLAKQARQSLRVPCQFRCTICSQGTSCPLQAVLCSNCWGCS